MPAPTRLGEFLAARRAQLQPDDAGVAVPGERRRVPGLRREELAALAGVSPSYYTRLEQGHAHRASAAVLDAIAAALRLGPDERDHLRRLAATPRRPAPGRGPVARADPEHAHPETRRLLAAMSGVPAWVQGRRTDVLAWNPLAHALLAGHLDPDAPERPEDRPTTAELVFVDPHGRALYTDWERKARAVVGNLRLAAGRHPDDPELADLLATLAATSPDFASRWADHRIRACDAAAYELRHPTVGTVSVVQQSFEVVASPGQSLLTMVPADERSAHAVTVLGPAGATSPRPRAGARR